MPEAFGLSEMTYKSVEKFIQKNIGDFHRSRIQSLEKLKLTEIVQRKNPYLFRAKNIVTASDLVQAILDARLSSSEEGLFGNFLEELAIFVAKNAGGGVKSAIKGIDIELVRDGVRYLIAVKSGKNW